MLLAILWEHRIMILPFVINIPEEIDSSIHFKAFENILLAHLFITPLNHF